MWQNIVFHPHHTEALTQFKKGHVQLKIKTREQNIQNYSQPLAYIIEMLKNL